MNKFNVWDNVVATSYNWDKQYFTKIVSIENWSYEIENWLMFPEEALEKITQTKPEDEKVELAFWSLYDYYISWWEKKIVKRNADCSYKKQLELIKPEIIDTIRNFRKRFHNKFKSAEVFWNHLENEIFAIE